MRRQLLEGMVSFGSVLQRARVHDGRKAWLAGRGRRWLIVYSLTHRMQKEGIEAEKDDVG